MISRMSSGSGATESMTTAFCPISTPVARSNQCTDWVVMRRAKIAFSRICRARQG